ncbi:MAG: hypothetical protein EB084_23590, partial [Proteobacteria bacterium]|nr:hypothetical protein [Pseudomonadota bacterium]
MNDLRVDGAVAPTSTRATSGSLRPERSSQGEVSSDATPQIASPTEKHRALDANARSHEILRALQSNGKSPQKTPSNASDRAAHAVARPTSAFVATVQKNFVKWDTDKDGKLTDPEIDRACEDPTNRGKAAAALDVLERGDDDPSFKGFGAAELRAAEAKFKKGDTSCDAQMAYYTSRIDEYHKQSGLYGASGHPSISDINQSGEGDCFFLAALGAKVKRDPASVERMIAPHDDGSYTVSFAKEDVHVAPLTDAELGRAASSGGNGRWVAVVERAYADYKTRQDASKEVDPYDAFNGGGLIERAMGDMGATNVQSFNFAGTNPNKLPSLDGFRGHLQGFL